MFFRMKTPIRKVSGEWVYAFFSRSHLHCCRWEGRGKRSREILLLDPPQVDLDHTDLRIANHHAFGQSDLPIQGNLPVTETPGQWDNK